MIQPVRPDHAWVLFLGMTHPTWFVVGAWGFEVIQQHLAQAFEYFADEIKSVGPSHAADSFCGSLGI